MHEMVRPWEAEQPLTSLTLWADWDSVSSMILSLRIHLFDYGTIPVWNFMFCGGRPELSVPYSWAYTWPSLFAYALPPIYAILALWISMTLVGFLAARALFLRWSGSRAGASIGAALYVLSGSFAARFNAGHITFAFFHLTPVLMLLFELGFTRALERRPICRIGLLSTLAGFLFMSAALPHPLLHFYPAFVLLVVSRLALSMKRRGVGASLSAAMIPLLAHVLGVWLAAYKLWPVMRWQMGFPRQGVLYESYTITEVLLNTLTFVHSYIEPLHVSWHRYPPWGYNAFVGEAPWICALLVVACLLAGRHIGAAARVDERRFFGRGRAGVAFGLVLVVVGFALALGNANPASPAYFFRHLPMLDGVRAYNRYQILIVFGLAILVSQSAAVLSVLLERHRGLRRLGLALLALLVVAPVAFQSSRLVWNVLAEPNEHIAQRYRQAPPAGPPRQIRNSSTPLRRCRHQTSLMQQGFWIARCYSDISLPVQPNLPKTRVYPLSRPAPTRIARIERDSISLYYEEPLTHPVVFHLRQLDEFEVYAVELSVGSLHTLHAELPGPREGAAASLAGLLTAAIFFSLLALRERRYDVR